ncbi:MAG: hypothetical protein ACK5Z3_16670 [Pseudanabaena sp.]
MANKSHERSPSYGLLHHADIALSAAYSTAPAYIPMPNPIPAAIPETGEALK